MECRLQAWDQNAGEMTSLVHFLPPGPLGRPAVDYLYFANAGVGINPDYIPVAWESIDPGQTILRCKVGVMD